MMDVLSTPGNSNVALTVDLGLKNARFFYLFPTSVLFQFVVFASASFAALRSPRGWIEQLRSPTARIMRNFTLGSPVLRAGASGQREVSWVSDATYFISVEYPPTREQAIGVLIPIKYVSAFLAT